MKPEDEFIELIAERYSLINIPKNKVVELDLGCGKGSFTTKLAKKYPERLVFAVDVMLGRLRKLHKRNERSGINNMQLLRCEAWHLINQGIPDTSLNRIHILCPDPWPKSRHKGNRLVSSEFVSRLYIKLKKNGIFHFSSDDIPYFTLVQDVLGKSDLFIRDDSRLEDISDIKTDFEERWNDMGLKVFHSAWIKRTT
ncbi:MAG TPA: methyltransferase domain-containing protein [Victivallales bacterium]|nr:methyltransferase domain-containing protein [Victivallales bacterium]